MLWVVVSILLLIYFLTKQAQSQSNKQSSIVFYTTAELKQFVLYKDDPKTLERTKIAEEIYRAERLIGRYGGNCVQFVKRYYPNLPQIGAAKNLETNSETPQAGAIVKTRESSLGHLAYVLYVKEEKILVVESNYGWDGIINMRWIDTDDENIVGYFVP